MRLLSVYQDERLASSRVRVLQMQPHLAAVGVTAECVPYPSGVFALRRVLRRARDFDAVLLLIVASCFLSVGYTTSVHAVRLGDISFTAPFRYSVLVFALILQIIVFRDVPDALTFIGIFVVAAAGFYALAREPRVVPPVSRG